MKRLLASAILLSSHFTTDIEVFDIWYITAIAKRAQACFLKQKDDQ